MSYGQNLIDNYRRSATYVDKILKGRKPRETGMSRLWGRVHGTAAAIGRRHEG